MPSWTARSRSMTLIRSASMTRHPSPGRFRRAMDVDLPTPGGPAVIRAALNYEKLHQMHDAASRLKGPERLHINSQFLQELCQECCISKLGHVRNMGHSRRPAKSLLEIPGRAENESPQASRTDDRHQLSGRPPQDDRPAFRPLHPALRNRAPVAPRLRGQHLLTHHIRHLRGTLPPLTIR